MPAITSPRGRTLRAGAVLIACVFALAACKKGDGDAVAKGKDGKDKGPDAIPVEVMAAAKRPIAASYTGTAPLEARGESQVVAKTSRKGRSSAPARCWCAWMPRAPRCRPRRRLR